MYIVYQRKLQYVFIWVKRWEVFVAVVPEKQGACVCACTCVCVCVCCMCTCLYQLSRIIRNWMLAIASEFGLSFDS